MHDYGNNDNYRVVVRKSSSLSKGGINGNNDNGGGDLAAGGSLVKGALKKNASANSGSGAIASGAGASANKDRPWRNNSSSSSSAPPRANYDGNYDEDTVEFSASSLATPPPPPPSSKSSTSTSTTTLSTPTSRWAQYERNPNLEEESKIATSKAVVRVAERFAKHQRDVDDMEMMAENVEEEEEEEVRSTATTAVMGGATGTGYARTKAGTGASTATAAVEMSTTDYVKSRLTSLLVDTKQQQKLQGGQQEEDDDYSFGKYIPNNSINNSNYDHDRVRSEAFKMLNLANRVCSPPRKGNNNSGGDDDDDGNLNDTADTTTNNTTSAMNKATALFRTKGGGIAMREMQEDEIAEIRRNGIASIRGLDRFGKFDRSSNNSSSSSYDANYGITPSNKSSADHDTNMNDDPNEETPSLWSSRYSVERQLMAITGGLDSTRMLHRMDMLHTARDKTKSARGLYRASSNAMDGSHVEYGDYTTNSSSNLGFGFSTGGDWGVWKWVRGTLWSDDMELNYDGTTQSLVKREKSMQHRRRLRFGLLFIVTLGIVLGVLVHKSNPNLAGSGGGGGGGNVNFYVLADEPYEYANIEQLTRDLESVPSDADFVIHLGNVNGDEQSMCREYGFERAAAVLKESPVPVLVIPGDLDWAACGSEEESTHALNYWQIYLGQFDKYWNANQNNQLVDVEYDTSVVGNFAFIHKGVLFVGISMIDGLTSPGEVTSRLERNVIWTKDKLTKYSSDNTNDEDGGKKSKGYHAVVIFGHAPPSDIQGEYFWPMLEQFKKVDVPVLYLHANKSGSFEQYKPYDEVEKFCAVQLEKRGLEGPMRVVVRGGKRNVDNKFVFERRQTSLEREEE
jgi:hypothetical protein